MSIEYWSASPVPALTFGTALIAKGLSMGRPAEIASSGLKFSRTLATARPTKLSCFLFGGAQLVGGWINIDGDPLNAAGFSFAWSTLYLLVNGGASVKSIARGRVSPVALSVLALGNVGLYGKKFFWPAAKLGPV